MRRSNPARSALLGVGVLLVAGCGGSGGPSGADDDITSISGSTLEFAFSAEVVARADETPRKAIATQLRYTQGILTTEALANAQAGMPTLANVRETVAGDKKRITYDAKLAIVWPTSSRPSSDYKFYLPRDTTELDRFNATYDGKCGRNEYGQDTFWHDFNPKAPGCKLEDADVVVAPASIRPHPQTTQNQYPEYDKIWEDDSLDVVAVFGLIAGDTPEDEGARTRERLLEDVARSVQNVERSEAPPSPGILKESTLKGTVEVGGRPRRVSLTAFLVSEVSSAGPVFEERYARASTPADIVIYEGHSGLGKNVNTLARATVATPGKYQLVYLYGCQTLAYLEPTMHERRIALNGATSDPEGTKYLDIIATALPAYGDDGASSIGLYETMLASSTAPKTFREILGTIKTWHLATVFGEHDNTFRP